MNTKFYIEDPGSIEATIKIRMTINRWQELREQLAAVWPSSELSSTIGDLLRQVDKEFFPRDGEL